MKTTEHTDKIDAALLEVQRGLKLLEKDKGVEVERSGTRTSSRYATGAAVYKACHELLVTAGITLWQGGGRDEKGSERLYTVLAKGGQQRVSDFPILAREGAQNFGGGLAFAKRWGLQAAVGIFTTDDKDESAGYQQAQREARPAKRAAAPANIGAQLTELRAADTTERFAALALEARASHPVGEPAAAVERTIGQWFVDALGVVADLPGLTDLRSTATKVKPRGAEVREAIRDACARLGAT